MKCKNCGHEPLEHPWKHCKQFIPKEEQVPSIPKKYNLKVTIKDGENYNEM